MNITTKQLKAWIRTAELSPRSYSRGGRTCYAECVGVEVMGNEELALGLRLLEASQYGPEAVEREDVFDSFLFLMMKARSDGAGRESVIVYWPTMLWEADELDATDEDADDVGAVAARYLAAEVGR